jgi:hypothetical protein
LGIGELLRGHKFSIASQKNAIFTRSGEIGCEVSSGLSLVSESAGIFGTVIGVSLGINKLYEEFCSFISSQGVIGSEVSGIAVSGQSLVVSSLDSILKDSSIGETKS